MICGISIIAFTAVKGYSGYVVFSWAYGFFLGGYNYALKVYTYERVRARHFPRAWSFVQSSQAIPIFIGTPLISKCEKKNVANYGIIMRKKRSRNGDKLYYDMYFSRYSESILWEKVGLLHSSSSRVSRICLSLSDGCEKTATFSQKSKWQLDENVRNEHKMRQVTCKYE